eukprot:3138353-Rhodomonas_salina.1
MPRAFACSFRRCDGAGRAGAPNHPRQQEASRGGGQENRRRIRLQVAAHAQPVKRRRCLMAVGKAHVFHDAD